MITRTTKEMRLVYRDFLARQGESREDLAILEADLSSSMSTSGLKTLYGKRYVNLGIMEAQMIGLAAGLSLMGYKPYVHTFGPFASRRVYDQLFISLGYAQLGATIVGSDAGVSAEMNGGTHMPFEELGLLRLIPNSRVYEVSDDVQFQAVLEQTLESRELNYIRTIRKQPVPLYRGDEDFSKGFIVLKEGSDITLVASGIMVATALEAAEVLEKEGYSVGVIDLFRIKPIHADLKELLVGKPIVTAENHNVIGGLGSAVTDLVADQSNTPVRKVGIQERFGQVGKMDYLIEAYGLTKETIIAEARHLLP